MHLKLIGAKLKKRPPQSQRVSGETHLVSNASLASGYLASQKNDAPSRDLPATAGGANVLLEQFSDEASILLTLRDVSRITRISRSSLYNMLAANEFVRPFKISERARAIRFLDSEVRAWIAERVAQRDAKERGV